jgi:hypothetical protein
MLHLVVALAMVTLQAWKAFRVFVAATRDPALTQKTTRVRDRWNCVVKVAGPVVAALVSFVYYADEGLLRHFEGMFT